MIVEARTLDSVDISAVEARIERIFAEQQRHRFALAASSADERIDKLKRFLALILNHAPQISRALFEDFRKSEMETQLTEVVPVVSEIRHTISHLHEWMRPQPAPRTLALLTTEAWVQYEPRGVCLIIAPWNYPFHLMMLPLVHAIAAGNTAVLKPSEYTPATSALMRELLGELFDEKEAAVFEGDARVSQALLKKPFDHIFFTGSPTVGKMVMRAAAEHLSSVTLELGGKSPVIVDPSAHLKDAAYKIAAAKFYNNGQTCIAPDYLLVHESKRDELVAYLKQAIEDFYGSTEAERENTPDYARIISERHAARIAEMIDDAVSRGARLAIGGVTKPADRYISPTVLVNVPEDSKIMQEEIFGPALPVQTYQDLSEAIAAVQSRPKPLSMYVFSSRNDDVKRLLNQCSAGMTCINDAGVQGFHSNLPFGGVNWSGLGGASHGIYGFRAFSHERSVLKHHRFSPFKVFFPPFKSWKLKLVQLAAKIL